MSDLTYYWKMLRHQKRREKTLKKCWKHHPPPHPTHLVDDEVSASVFFPGRWMSQPLWHHKRSSLDSVWCCLRKRSPSFQKRKKTCMIKEVVSHMTLFNVMMFVLYPATHSSKYPHKSTTFLHLSPSPHLAIDCLKGRRKEEGGCGKLEEEGDLPLFNART